MTDKKRVAGQFEGEKKDAVEILMGSKSSLSSKLDKPELSSKPSKPEYKRATYIVKQEYIEKIKSLAYWERKEITQVVNEALEQYLQDKKTRPIPEH